MDSDELSPPELAIVNQLREGARTTGFLVDNIEYSKAHLNTHLRVLLAKGIVQKLHEGTALYELVDDPISDDDATSDEPEVVLRRLSKELAEPISVGDHVYEDGDMHTVSEGKTNHTEEEKESDTDDVT